MMELIFSTAGKRGYLRDDSTINAVSNLYINIVNRTFQPEFFFQEDASLKDTIELFSNIMAKGIFNNKGINILEKIKKENN